MKPTKEKNPHAVALGRIGGSAGKGASKARSSEQMRAAANARWGKVKADTKVNPEPARKGRGNATSGIIRAAGDSVTVDGITVKPMAYLVNMDCFKFPGQP